jgi:imidazolonepropionase-like amidohydrolase
MAPRTYVTVHAYTPAAMQRSIAAGMKCIEHGHLMDEPTAKLMAEKGIWLSHQVFPDELANAFPPGSDERIKAKSVFDGSNLTLRFAMKHKIKTVFGTDLIFSAPLAKRQGAMLTLWAPWYTPAETLAMATGNAAELLTLSGKRNPYPGKLGVVQESALADLLLVDGNPLDNIKLLADPEKNLAVIMKDGKIYKNTLKK